MNINSPEFCFTLLLFLHVLTNTVSRITQRLLGNDDPIFDTACGTLNINFRNRAVIQGMGLFLHVPLLFAGLYAASEHKFTAASWAYLGIAGGGVTLLTVITNGLDKPTNKTQCRDAAKQRRQTWIGFYSLVFIGCITFGFIGKWNSSLVTIDLASFALFLLNQLFCGSKAQSPSQQPDPA